MKLLKKIKETKEWIDQAQNTMTRENLWSNQRDQVEYDKKVKSGMKSQN